MHKLISIDTQTCAHRLPIKTPPKLCIELKSYGLTSSLNLRFYIKKNDI